MGNLVCVLVYHWSFVLYVVIFFIGTLKRILTQAKCLTHLFCLSIEGDLCGEVTGDLSGDPTGEVFWLRISFLIKLIKF